MANIYLLKYNNYFNRIVKTPYTNLVQYLDSHEYVAFFGMNFNPNDNVTTAHVFNYKSDMDFNPDYCIVENENTMQFTRWFITESVRLRGGQYRISLKRDVLADFYNETLSATSFVNKGFVSAENALIFNSEGVKVNQIKKSEILLKDSTRAAWIVGYLAPNLAAEGDVDVNISYEQETIPDISEFEYSDYIGKEVKGLINNEQSYFSVYTQRGATARTVVTRYLNNKGQAQYIGFGQNYPRNTIYITNKNTEQMENIPLEMNYNVFQNVLADVLGNSDFLEILSLKGKIYKEGDTYKRVTITPNEEESFVDYNVTSENAPRIYEEVTNCLDNNNIAYRSFNTSNYISIPMRLFYSSFTLTLEEVGSPITNAKVTFKSTIKQLKDAPYKMFCIPVADNAIIRFGSTDIYTNKDRMLQIAASIATGLKTSAEGFLYDLQLLPYCPIEDKFILTYDVNGIEYIGAGEEHKDYDVIKDSADNAVAYMFYADRSSFTTNVTSISSINYPTLDIDKPIEFKAKNETYLFRLVAPNYANSDNFNVFMNYGINYFNVDCTYKPLTPYIKISINYKGLYGQDFNDQRGLILGGDYSLPVISDNWINYQIQNKNYAAIFERETQHLEYQHKRNMASAVTGAITGTAAGSLIGSQLGSAALGGGVSALGGVLDIASAAASHGESMDYRRDTYQMNLQNIQALPQGLVKTSAFNYNSKIFPFVEIYHCTDTEYEMVKNKIKYSGMTLNTIGSIANYLNPSDITYIQGKLIKIDIGEDSHMANAINQELNMGVYYE